MTRPAVDRLGAAGRALAAVALVLGLSGCGGSDSTPTMTPTPAPTPPPPVVVLDGTGGIPTCGENCTVLARDTFSISSTGTIDVTVDYTYDDSQLGVWVASGICEFEQFVMSQCTLVATGFTGKPIRVSATNQAAGSYTLFLGNGGPREESVSFQVVFTPSATAGRPPAASARRELDLGGGRFVPGGRLGP